MKLFKKLILALSMLLLLGMITSCGGGAGAGGGPSSSGDGYKVVYNGEIIADDLDEVDLQMYVTCCGLVEYTDYSIDESTKTITLTATGKTKVDAFENAMTSGVVYTINYNGLTLTQIPEGMLSYFLSDLGLESDTDYTIDDTEHTVTLTESGFAKLGE